MANSIKTTKTMGMKNKKNLGLTLGAPKTVAPSSQDAQIPGALANDNSDPGTLEIGVEFKLDLRNEDLIVLRELGAGNGGTVSKVQHTATKVIMAKKVSIYTDPEQASKQAKAKDRSYTWKQRKM